MHSCSCIRGVVCPGLPSWMGQLAACGYSAVDKGHPAQARKQHVDYISDSNHGSADHCAGKLCSPLIQMLGTEVRSVIYSDKAAAAVATKQQWPPQQQQTRTISPVKRHNRGNSANFTARHTQQLQHAYHTCHDYRPLTS